MRTPVLETKRLILRPLRREDAKEVYENWKSDPEVARYMGWSTHKNVEATQKRMAAYEEELDSDGGYEWGLERKSDHMLIGSAGISYQEDRNMFMLGYELMKDCWRQGYTSEAVAGILKFVTEELGLTRILASHAKENPNSGKVLEKAGFHYACDTTYDTADGRHFEAREYLYEKDPII